MHPTYGCGRDGGSATPAPRSRAGTSRRRTCDGSTGSLVGCRARALGDRRAARLVGDAGQARRAGARPAVVPQEEPDQPRSSASRFAVLISRFDYRLLRAYTPILYGASVARAARRALAAGHDGQRRARVDLPAGRLLAAAVGVREDRDHPRDGDDPLGEARRRERAARHRRAASRSASPRSRSRSSCCSPTSAPSWSSRASSSASSPSPARRRAGSSASSPPASWSGFVAIQVGILKQYQLDRLTAFTNPTANTRDIGYNTQQARIAIGSGGMFGTGLFHGPQTQGRFVPENQTDFVYSVAGEELGFVGAALIIALLGLVLWRAIRIALRASDLFGRLVATGVVCWFAFQAFENIGMNLGIMPVTGVPLPVRLLRRHLHVRQLDGRRPPRSTSTSARRSDALEEAGPDQHRVGSCVTVPREMTSPEVCLTLSVESVFPQLEALLPLVTKPIQYVGGELNAVSKPWDAVRGALGAHVPRRVRGRACPTRACRSSTRSSTSTPTPSPSAPTPCGRTSRRSCGSTASRSSRSTATARSVRSTCSASASPPSSATPTCSPRSTSPASRCTRATATSRTRSSSPAVTRRSTPRRSPTSSTPRSSATASRPCSRSPRSSATGRPRAAPAAARSCCCASRAPVASTSRRSTTSTTSPTVASSASRRTAPASRGGSRSTPSWTSTSGPTRRRRWCRSPRACTSG